MKRILLSTILSAVLVVSSVLMVNAQGTESVNVNSPMLYSSKDNIVSTKEGKTVTKVKKYENGIKQKISDICLEKTVTGTESFETHEKEISYEVPLDILEEKAANNIFTLEVNAKSVSDSKSDKTGTVKCYSTLNYTISTTNNREYIKLNKASGKLVSLTGHTGSSQGSGISITSNKVLIGRDGVNASGKYVSNTKNITCANKPCSWSYSPSWSKVGYGGQATSVYKMNSQQTVKLKRGNSTWTLTFKNDAF